VNGQIDFVAQQNPLDGVGEDALSIEPADDCIGPIVAQGGDGDDFGRLAELLKFPGSPFRLPKGELASARADAETSLPGRRISHLRPVL
jgi:hypothetical protein